MSRNRVRAGDSAPPLSSPARRKQKASLGTGAELMTRLLAAAATLVDWALGPCQTRMDRPRTDFATTRPGSEPLSIIPAVSSIDGPAGADSREVRGWFVHELTSQRRTPARCNEALAASATTEPSEVVRRDFNAAVALVRSAL